MNQGNGLTEVTHPLSVSDGHWHNVTVVFNYDVLDLNIDGSSELKKPVAGAKKQIDLTNRLVSSLLLYQMPLSRSKSIYVHIYMNGIEAIHCKIEITRFKRPGAEYFKSI